MESKDFQTLLVIAIQVGYKRCLIDLGKEPTYISKREAEKRFGAGTVRRWLADGVVVEHKDGDRNCKCRINHADLITAAATDNRCEYFKNK